MIKRLLLIVVGIALFVFVLSKVDLASAWKILSQADLKLCLLALVTFIVMIYLKGIRWSYLLKMQGYRYSIWNCFLIYMGSMYWGNITPGRAGDFMKVLYLKEDLKLPMGTGMTSVLVDRVFDLYILLILGCAGILIYPMPADPHLTQLIWIFMGILILITFLAFNRRIGKVLIRAVFQKVVGAHLHEKANKAFEEFHRGMNAFYNPLLAIPAFLSALSYILAFWACSLLAQAIGIQVNFFYLAFSISVVNIVSLLTFLGMGTREGALIILFGLISLSREQALAFSLLLLLVGTILFSAVAFFCYLLKPIDLSGLFPKKANSDVKIKKTKKRSKPRR